MDPFAKETLPVSLEEEMRRSYLDYAMSVIVGRALPDVRDGLKPVHRRVLFAMYEAGNLWNRPYVKCARVVGEVLGKYHPHGDTTTYDALVRMAQDFSLRYPLIDGQGNLGSIDGDNPAAYRYTACRLDRIASDLLADIANETVDFVPSYDGNAGEPAVMRALLERVGELVNDKKIEGISDIRDESDKSGMRVVFELKRGELPDVVLNNLYKLTQLQDTFGMNMVALVEGQPRLLDLKQMLEAFLAHRREVVMRRTGFELRQARARCHVLEGLAVALASIDDFIAIIRAAPTPPVAKTELMTRRWDSPMVRDLLARSGADAMKSYRPEGLPPQFGIQDDGLYQLSEEQAEQILQMRLQRLTGLEQDKIVAEYREVISQIGDLLDVLARPERRNRNIHHEIVEPRRDPGRAARGARAP